MKEICKQKKGGMGLGHDMNFARFFLQQNEEMMGRKERNNGLQNWWFGMYYGIYR